MRGVKEEVFHACDHEGIVAGRDEVLGSDPPSILVGVGNRSFRLYTGRGDADTRSSSALIRDQHFIFSSGLVASAIEMCSREVDQ